LPNANQTRALTWEPGPPIEEFESQFRAKSFWNAQKEFTADGWRLESPAVLRLLEKLRLAGKPLGEYVNDRFYRGITTGLNEAYVVDSPTRDRLIAEHPSSAELLKPFLRGRDVKRWLTEPQDTWLIFTRRGVSINKYPAIRDHLRQYKNQLMPGVEGGRKPGNYQWYEIQDNIAYWQEFEKPKIVSTKVSIRPTFAFDANASYLGNTSYFLPVQSHRSYLMALLNSKLFHAYAKKVFVEKQNGWYEVQPEGLEMFPIPSAPSSDRTELERLVGCILKATAADHAADVAALEREIDLLVYRLYGLTPEEIAIVEGNSP
jgi:hypothetical protein